MYAFARADFKSKDDRERQFLAVAVDRILEQVNTD